jgi:hypothetical protein
MRKNGARDVVLACIHKALGSIPSIPPPYKIQAIAAGVAQAIEHLPSKYELLSSTPSTTKKKGKIPI